MKKNNTRIIPQRLQHLRLVLGLTQTELGNAIAENFYASKGERISLTSGYISHWETGAKPIPLKYMNTLCDVLGCTEEYLLGISQDPTSSDPSKALEKNEVISPMPDSIPLNSLYKYDQLPIYIVFNELQHANCWGLLNIKMNKIILSDSVISLSSIDFSSISIYPANPNFTAGIKSASMNKLSFADAINSKVVYIEVCSNDATIRSQYEGYYHHNENQTCFINNSGLTLPYDGINRYYNVYSVARF